MEKEDSVKIVEYVFGFYNKKASGVDVDLYCSALSSLDKDVVRKGVRYMLTNRLSPYMPTIAELKGYCERCKEPEYFKKTKCVDKKSNFYEFKEGLNKE